MALKPKRSGGESSGRGYYDLAAQAVKELLVEKRVISDAEILNLLATAGKRGPQVGARIVAKAWTDAGFKKKLLADGKRALAEIGVPFGEAQLKVVENTPRVHHLICCSLCSCYPRSLLGQPPFWYRNPEFRSRAVRDPRKVLKELGVTVPARTAVHVHESNADIRYLVVPQRPAGTEALDEAALAALVTRDCLVGGAQAKAPGRAGRASAKGRA